MLVTDFVPALRPSLESPGSPDCSRVSPLKQTTTSMEITCKDIRHNRRLTVPVHSEDKVEDLINKIRMELGEENSYRLVSGGKIMREVDPVRSYFTLSVLPVIVMVTSPAETHRHTQQIRSVIIVIMLDTDDILAEKCINRVIFLLNVLHRKYFQ